MTPFRFRGTTWVLLTGVPLLLFVALMIIFWQQVVRDVPVAWVDHDHTTNSRHLFRQLDASPSIKLITYSSSSKAEADMASGQVYGFIIVPKSFSAQIQRHQQPNLRVVVNGQLVLVAKVIRAAVASVLGVDQAIDRALQTLVLTQSSTDAVFSAAPVRVQLIPLFNQAGSYGQFLLPAIFLAIWQILIAVTSVVVLTERAKDNQASDVGWIASELTLKPMIHRLACLSPWFLLQGIIGFILLYEVMGYPFFGSYLSMISIAVLFVICCQSLALLICLYTPDPARATSLTGAITAPSFAFLGVTFPSSDMPSLALWWRDILPAAQSSELMISLANYGLVTSNHWPSVLCQFVIILSPFMLFRVMKRELPV